MGFRSASILTLIISGIIIGCTDAVSTNYHDRTSYYSDKAIETQKVLGNVDYQGVSFAELCSRLGLSGKPKDNMIVINRCLEGINSKLGLHIKLFPYYKGRKLVRIRFYCEEEEFMWVNILDKRNQQMIVDQQLY